MMVIPKDNNRYNTSDTAVAAYLYSKGYKLLTIDASKFPSIFIFKQSKGLEDAAHEFQIGTAEGNVFLFFRAYRKMLSKMKEAEEVVKKANAKGNR